MTIRELAETIRRIVGFEGELGFDASKPDGSSRKLLDVSRVRALGWTARISLAEGMRSTYEWFRRNVAARGSEKVWSRKRGLSPQATPML